MLASILLGSMTEAPALNEVDRPMGRTYALVVVCHVVVIALLWWFGRVFSS